MWAFGAASFLANALETATARECLHVSISHLKARLSLRGSEPMKFVG